jgi:hypothetical protein
MTCSPPPPDLADRSDPPQDRSAQDRPPADSGRVGCTARLLHIVRRLITYGIQLGTTLRTNPADVDPMDNLQRFGTFDIALILRRITRGLLLAAALEARLLTRVDPPEHAPQPTTVPPRDALSRPRPKCAARPAPGAWRAAADAALLDRLPTAEEIAAQVRGRPIGAIILDIFRDLGILPGDPVYMWREMSPDILVTHGNLTGLFREITQRMYDWMDETFGDLPLVPAPPQPSLPVPAASGAGPP